MLAAFVPVIDARCRFGRIVEPTSPESARCRASLPPFRVAPPRAPDDRHGDAGTGLMQTTTQPDSLDRSVSYNPMANGSYDAMIGQEPWHWSRRFGFRFVLVLVPL